MTTDERGGVSSGSDRQLLASQYATGANLASRVQVYDYLEPAEPTGGFPEWVVDHVDWRSPKRVADVGCGPGPYLDALRRRAARVTAVDRSVGMLRELGARVPAGSAVATVAGDAAHLPLADGSVDVVVAAHTLYHVEDIGGAVAEFRRILRPGGTLLVVLNGATDKREIRDTWRRAAQRTGRRFDPPWWAQRANLENTPAVVAKVFSTVTTDRLTGVFRFPSSAPPLTWVDSLRPGTEELLDTAGWAAVREALARMIDAAIARDGEFRVTKESGVIVAA